MRVCVCVFTHVLVRCLDIGASMRARVFTHVSSRCLVIDVDSRCWCARVQLCVHVCGA
jgi:hypothetical protein